LLQNVKSVHFREQKIEQYEVNACTLSLGQSGFSIGGLNRFVSGGAKRIHNAATYGVLIFDHNHGAFFCHHEVSFIAADPFVHCSSVSDIILS